MTSRHGRPRARNPRGLRSPGQLDAQSARVAAGSAVGRQMRTLNPPSNTIRAGAEGGLCVVADARNLRPCGRWAAQLQLGTRGYGAVRSFSVGRESRQLVRRDALCGVAGIRCPCLASVGAPSPLLSRFVCALNPQPMFADFLFAPQGSFSRALQVLYPFVYLRTRCSTHISEYPDLRVALASGVRCGPRDAILVRHD